MKESIGMTMTINIMIVFLLVTFAFIFGTMSYSKAYRASSVIINALEKYEGFNEDAFYEMNNGLQALTYLSDYEVKCPEKKKNSSGEGKLQSLEGKETRNYCIYLFKDDGDTIHYTYGVVTYMTFELHLFGMNLRIPIYNTTRRIYKFGDQQYPENS